VFSIVTVGNILVM